MANMILEIIELANGGRGLGRTDDGKIVFVTGALAGEEVEAKVTGGKRDYFEAETVRVIRPSSNRVKPVCPEYERCGGCDLMHLEYEAQLEAKAAWVDRAMHRVAGVPAVKPFASPQSFGWRNRVSFQARQGGIGFFKRNSNSIVKLKSCPVAFGTISEMLPGLNQALGRFAGREVMWAEALALKNQGPMLTLTLRRDVRLSPQMKRNLRVAGRKAGAELVRLARGGWIEDIKPSDQTGMRYYKEPGLELLAFPGLFAQVNFAVNRRLIEIVKKAAQGIDVGSVLDLYAGSGNLSLPLANAGWQVSAVEVSQSAVEIMGWQGRSYGLLELMQLRSMDAGQALAEMSEQGQRFDLVVLDPPRAGAKGMMPHLASLEPKRIVYVSCHPAALARDAKLLADYGYNPLELHALDMFPQTSHVEAVLVLERN